MLKPGDFVEYEGSEFPSLSGRPLIAYSTPDGGQSWQLCDVDAYGYDWGEPCLSAAISIGDLLRTGPGTPPPQAKPVLWSKPAVMAAIDLAKAAATGGAVGAWAAVPAELRAETTAYMQQCSWSSKALAQLKVVPITKNADRKHLTLKLIK
jgi:hypothetical protein